MLTGRHFLEWGWRHPKSLGHPWDWLQISAACLSSTSFPAQSPFLVASPDRLVCISGKWLLWEREGSLRTSGREDLVSHGTQEIFARWINKSSMPGLRRWFPEPEMSAPALLMTGTGVFLEPVFWSALLFQHWQIRMHCGWSTSVPATCSAL